MAKRPPEKYNPGELDRTRKNIGILSEEETKKMSSVLGGEVGIEKSNPAIDKRYSKLKEKRNTGYIVDGGTYTYSSNYEKEKKLEPKKVVKKKNAKPVVTSPKRSSRLRKLGYLDRINIDQLAARPEHQIKTKGDLFRSYLSFLIKGRDRVNPDFVNNCDAYFYTNLNILVSSLEALLKIIKPSIFKFYINPYYRSLYKVILSWKVDAINDMLTYLQKQPRRRETVDFGSICKELFRPIFILRDCEEVHFFGAIERLYKILLLIHADNQKQVDFIKKNYLNVRANISIVFRNNPYACYPLMLKLTETKYVSFDDFLKMNDKYIFQFLGLNSDQILKVPLNMDEVRKQEYSLNHLKLKLEKEKEEVLEKMKNQRMIRTESEIEPALVFLDKLFPKSGWNKYKEFPDFYPYFQPIFKFPRGTELISQEDPLQQVIILVTIIGELLYGFRGIKIASDVSSVIERIINKWNLFMDNIIRNYYSKRIIEYCSYIDKDSVTHTTKFAQKLVTDINWFKVKFIFPFLKYKSLYKSDTTSVNSPKLYEQVAFFYNSLKTLLEELDSSENKAWVVENFDEPFHFDVKNFTSIRLKKLLKQENLKASNENLLKYTFSLISMLDYLLNTKSSPWYYTDAEKIPIFREDPERSGRPQYSVELRKTRNILSRI